MDPYVLSHTALLSSVLTNIEGIGTRAERSNTAQGRNRFHGNICVVSAVFRMDLVYEVRFYERNVRNHTISPLRCLHIPHLVLGRPAAA